MSTMPGERPDKRVIAFNYTDGTSAVAAGALAYLRWSTGQDRHAVLARSRGGRWINTWRGVSQLRDFRVKTIPCEHPLYDRLTDYGEYAAGIAERLAADMRAVTGTVVDSTH